MSHVPQPRDDRVYRFGGRLFALFSLQHNTYCVPVDESEEIRLDELHRIVRDTCGGRAVLTPSGQFPPPDIDEPAVLDCGYGKGAWIDDLLGEFEDCEVTGVDIYLGDGNEVDEEDDDEDDDSDDDGVQEFFKKRWNLNAPFRHDHTATQLRPEQFDLINSRFLAEGINMERWPAYVRELKKILKPGGWLQMVELELLFQSDNGRLAQDSSAPLYVWSQWYRHFMGRMNKDPRVGRRLGRLMQDEGFEHVSAGPHYLRIGRWNAGSGGDIQENMKKTLASVLLWPSLGALQGQSPAMTTEQYRQMVLDAQSQLRDDSLKLYYQVYIAIGRRPLADRR